MKGRRIGSWVVALPLLFGGCAMYRIVEVDIPRVEVESPNAPGVTAARAADLFYHAANELGYAVQGPIHVSHSGYEYTGQVPGEPDLARPELFLRITEKAIRFESGIFGRKRDLAIAQQGAAPFRKQLEERGIHYQSRTGSRPHFVGP